MSVSCHHSLFTFIKVRNGPPGPSITIICRPKIKTGLSPQALDTFIYAFDVYSRKISRIRSKMTC